MANELLEPLFDGTGLTVDCLNAHGLRSAEGKNIQIRVHVDSVTFKTIEAWLMHYKMGHRGRTEFVRALVLKQLAELGRPPGFKGKWAPGMLSL